MDSKSLEAWRSATILYLQTYRSQKIWARLSKLQVRLIPSGRRSKWTSHVEVGGTRSLKILCAPERWYYAPGTPIAFWNGHQGCRGLPPHSRGVVGITCVVRRCVGAGEWGVVKLRDEGIP